MRPSKFSYHTWLAGLLVCSMVLSTALPLTVGSAHAAPGLSPDPNEREMKYYVPAIGGASTHPVRSRVNESLDDYDQAPVQTIADPIEPWNRFWFGFNDIFYLHIARPVYKGYTAVMPDEFQSGLRNFFFNLLFPMRFVNALLQGKPQDAGVEFGRFIVNSTVGFGGFIDATKGRKAVVQVDPDGEDFGQTLGVWGVDPGFYLVWPFIGPRNARDSVGMVGDWVLDPTFYIQPWYASWGAVVGLRFNALGDVLPTYANLKDISVDPYIAMREAYANYRQIQVVR